MKVAILKEDIAIRMIIFPSYVDDIIEASAVRDSIWERGQSRAHCGGSKSRGREIKMFTGLLGVGIEWWRPAMQLGDEDDSCNLIAVVQQQKTARLLRAIFYIIISSAFSGKWEVEINCFWVLNCNLADSLEINAQNLTHSI